MTQESYDTFWPKEDQQFFKYSHYKAAATLLIPVLDVVLMLFADCHSREERTSEKLQKRIVRSLFALL